MATVDGTLVTSAVAGDSAATDALLGLLRPGVLRYCRARLGDRRHRDSDAEDCAQEILLAVLDALPGYRHEPSRFWGFVYGVAAHKVVDAHRHRQDDVSVPVPEFAPVPSDRPGPLGHVEAAERRERLNLLLGQLAPQQRDVVVLRLVLGLSARDAAGVLGLAGAGAVRVSQHRALIALRRHIAASPVP
ncbi:sigma-70 family RNA polymerase sigma factor [Amycolatopsis sp. NPDC051758]|uniref:sigma-70 family RNA polymerase sigma factor n=1 Tax=Amycolatopsis sp. NPDC051758 TaxID=3363935 RepID=UPI0037A48CB1